MIKPNNKTFQFVLCHGLPGSGKSTLLQRLAAEREANDEYALYVDMDKFHKSGYERALSDAWHIAYSKKQKQNYSWQIDSDDTVTYLDTLCVNEREVVEVIYEVVARFAQCCEAFNYVFTIYDFNEDRLACIENNKVRAKMDPKRSAELTIRNAKYTPIDSDSITERVKDRIASTTDRWKMWIKDAPIKINVIIKAAKVWDRSTATAEDQVMADVLSTAYMVGEVIDNKMYGNDWTTGGETWGIDGPDNADPVSPDQPLDFDELDRMLEVLAPNLTFLQYKKIRKECCSINEFHVSDYYESYYKSQWVCDLKKLAEILVSIK